MAHAGSLPSVFRRLEELVLAASGEDDFDETFKLLVARLWDERSGGARFDARTAPALLDEAARAWPGLVDEPRFRLPDAALAACARVLAETRLTASAEALDAAFECLTARAAKGEKGQFFTPRHVVDFCTRLARPADGERVLDPACGSGAFLRSALARAKVAAFGWDFDARAVRVARAMACAAGAPPERIERRDSLARPTGDEGRFDVILTNPPFAGELRDRALLDAYRFGRGRARVERDVLFVERSVELLRPGGRLVMVLPHGLLAARPHAPLRRWLANELRVRAVIGLGRNTFQPHTGQKASVLVADRAAPSGAIFMAVSERDGKSPTGEWLGAHDLDEIAAAFEEHEQHGGLSRRHAG